MAVTGALTITRHLPISRAERSGVGPVSQNVRVRKLLIGLISAAAAVAIGAVGVDFGAAIYTEYRLARAIRSEARLSFDPSVGIIGFPFVSQARDRHYEQIEIHANGVDHAVVGKASFEATLYSVDLPKDSWLIDANTQLPVGKLESRIIIDSTHLGRFMGINDLMVEAPTKETNNATGGTTESGISGSKGLVFTGTPKAADFDKPVSVAVDLSIAGPDQTTLVFTATGVQTGAGTADQQVPDDKTAAVLAAFSSSLPGQKLPFGIAPTTEGARGSDIIIEGIAEGVTIRWTSSHSHDPITGCGHRRRHRGDGGGRRDQQIDRAAGRAAQRDQRAAAPGDRRHLRPGPVRHRTDHRAFQRGVVRTVRRGAAGGRSGVRRHARGSACRDRHGRQSGCGPRLSVMSLPTTFIFDADGRQRYRATGVPKAADLRSALEPLLA